MDSFDHERNLYSEAERLFNEKRYGEAFKLYEHLAVAGDVNCQTFVGWMYHEGLGVQKNEKEALRWFTGAATLGSKVGGFYCGKHALMHGRYEEAFKWLHASANQGYGPSLLWLGLAHVRGLGVSPDVPKGIGYLERAATAGNFPAKRELAVLMMRGKLGILRIPVGFLLLPYAALIALIDGISKGYSDKLMG